MKLRKITIWRYPEIETVLVESLPTCENYPPAHQRYQHPSNGPAGGWGRVGGWSHVMYEFPLSLDIPVNGLLLTHQQYVLVCTFTTYG